MHEDVDATASGRAEEVHSNVQDEAERSTTCRDVSTEGERMSVRMHTQSTTGVEGNSQHASRDDGNVPGVENPGISYSELHFLIPDSRSSL
jgi:hypothetical protein